MELQQVRYFLAVHETRNFTRAAERCRVSQPALTAGIKKLEAELNGPLFHRSRGGASLTVLGELVLVRCQKLAGNIADIHEIAFNHQHVREVPLRLGVLDTLGPNRVIDAMTRLREAAPRLELELHVRDHGALLRGLEDGDVELAITNAALVDEEWAVIVDLYREDYVVVLPPNDPLASRDEIALADLKDRPFIDRLSCEVRNALLSACQQRGFELYPAYRTEKEAWIESFVSAGIGFALMPEHSLQGETSLTRPLVEPAIHRQIAMVRNVDRKASPAAQLMWGLMRGS